MTAGYWVQKPCMATASGYWGTEIMHGNKHQVIGEQRPCMAITSGHRGIKTMHGHNIRSEGYKDHAWQ